MTMIESVKQAFCEEVEIMRSGLSMPYHKLSLMVALVTGIIFSVLLQHQVVFDGRIALIDLDDSRYSRELAQKLDASAYLEVHEIYHNAVDPVSLLMNDRNIGVLYIPKDCEKQLLNGDRSVVLGYYADYTNSAQNGLAMSSLNEIVAEEGYGTAVPKIATLGRMSTDLAEAAVSPMRILERRLFDPVFSSTNSFVIAITIFFSSIYLGLSVLMITGRLHATGQWERAVGRGSFSMASRLFPYVIFYCAGLSCAFCLLINFGQLRFEGSWGFFLLTLATTGLAIGLIAMILSWNAGNAGIGASFMILFVPPGFILGGSTMAIPFLTDWVRSISRIWPLTWQYSFLRDIAQRGEYQSGVLAYYGYYLLYIAFLALIFTVRCQAEQKRLRNGYRDCDIDGPHFERT